MTVTKIQLNDGIKLSTIQTDKFKSEVLSFTLSLSSGAKSAVLAMLLAGILKRGTKKYPSIADLNLRLDELYASSLDIRSTQIGKNMILTISADMLDGRFIPDGTDVFDGILELIYETLLFPRLENGLFPNDIFEQEKRFLCDSIDATVNNTRTYASLRLSELMMANDPEHLSIARSRDILKEIDSALLTKYLHKELLSSPIDVFYIGGREASEVGEKILSRFSSWCAISSKAPTLPYPEPICDYLSVSERMPVSQGKLAMGFKSGITISADKKEHYAVILFNELFGGSPASKLFMNVREKQSLCYYCSSSYNQYTGNLTVSSGIENKNRDIAERAILNEIQAIKDGQISDAELHAAKISLANSYKQIYDSPYDLRSFYSNRAFFGFSETPEELNGHIAALTKEDVVSVAQSLVCDSIFYVEGALAEEECDDE